jgi:CelD/BcsL family acetyltransferase involved in cellulose biosynthesis
MPDPEIEAVQSRAFERSEQAAGINPLLYPGWDALVEANAESSFFHRTAWARVLHETYGHQPIYFCRFVDGQLDELLPIMEISRPWMGRRGVSLPFTDVCVSLQGAKQDRVALYELAMEHGRYRRWQSLESRSNNHDCQGASPSLAFYGHTIDLRPGQEALFRSFHSAVRRGIRKAVRTGVRVEFDDRVESIQTFYALHRMTRRRHGLPPQPVRFFESIGQYALTQGHGFVATAFWEDKPLASAIFFLHRRKAIYKFGASDHDFQDLRPNNILMWQAIKRCVDYGFESLHLGRTSLANEGLRRFKLGFGAREDRIEYYKYDFAKQTYVSEVDHTTGWFNWAFRRMPLPVLQLAGELLYPHLS